MSVDKIILRAFLSTLAALAVLFTAMLCALLLFFPSTMMEITYSLGMENSSIRNAERAYGKGGDIYYIAHATQTAIEIENYEKINSCGVRLVEDDEFASFCAKKKEEQQNYQEAIGDYEQYIYGQICVAKYNLDKKQEAVDCAFSWTETNAFPKNNAIVALLLASLRAEDAETVTLIKGKMNERRGNLSEADKAYYEQILGLIAE